SSCVPDPFIADARLNKLRKASLHEVRLGQKEVVNKSKSRDPLTAREFFHLCKNILGIPRANCDVRVGTFCGATKRAVVRASTRANEVSLVSSIICPKGILRQKPAVNKRKVIDIRSEIMRFFLERY